MNETGVAEIEAARFRKRGLRELIGSPAPALPVKLDTAERWIADARARIDWLTARGDPLASEAIAKVERRIEAVQAYVDRVRRANRRARNS